MWMKGNVNGYEYEAKVYADSSDMGINRGRISKLDVMRNGKTVAHYDRGWDVRPTTAAEKEALKAILRKYPT